MINRRSLTDTTGNHQGHSGFTPMPGVYHGNKGDGKKTPCLMPAAEHQKDLMNSNFSYIKFHATLGSK